MERAMKTLVLVPQTDRYDRWFERGEIKLYLLDIMTWYSVIRTHINFIRLITTTKEQVDTGVYVSVVRFLKVWFPG